MIITNTFYLPLICASEGGHNQRGGNYRCKEYVQRDVQNIVRWATTRTSAGARELTLMLTTKAMLLLWKA